MIDSHEISVVVQGPIVGKKEWPAALRLTERCLQSIRQFLPRAEIILSTWNGSNVEGLSFDRLVESTDPGGTLIGEHKGQKTFFNCSRQIVSSRAGLQAAKRPYALKFRTDMVLESAAFLSYFGKYPQRAKEWAILKERVVVSTMVSRNPELLAQQPFAPSDWIGFGRTEDVLNIWDIPLIPEESNCTWFLTHPRPANQFEYTHLRYTPEQCIWLGFLRKYGPVPCEHMWDYGPHNQRLHELSFANNLVLASPKQLGIRFLKYWFGTINAASVYSHSEWQSLYARHCDPEYIPETGLRQLIKNSAVRLFRPRSWLRFMFDQIEYHLRKRTMLKFPR